ncbi:MAG: HAD-IB family hydrolase [Halioglobus sp.]|nr:HAD-IB family hydrolase [Halioglobus sp.]|tara:strand:+ start:1483 stop:2970 length:1488 start_codon:yes stop_codon:yes gene_type:complete
MPSAQLSQQLTTIEQDGNGDRCVAFFDLDRTLIAGYSIVAVARERIRNGFTRGDLVESSAILRDLLRHESRADAKVKGPAYQRLVKRMSLSLKGTPEEALARLGQQAYSNYLAGSLYSEAIALIEAHRRQGHHLVIVTAATRYQVEPIAWVLGIDEVCCTTLEVEDGVFTGHAVAPLCYGEGKAMAARRVCKRKKATLRNSYFYSDSMDDAPLLRIVGHPVAVNPSERLAVYARAKGWPQLKFGSRGLPSLETVLRTTLTAQTVAATAALGMLSKTLRVSSISNANRLTQLVGEVGTGFAGLDFEVEGMEHLRSDRPCIYIFNHQSFLDAMVLAHLLREDVVPMVKHEVADNVILGPLMRQVDTIFVDRQENNQSQVLRKALQVLRSGRSLVIAPEGTRSTLGEIQPFKHGAFFIAKKARVPVVPIVLHNVKDALPKGGLLIRPTTIRVTVLPPIYPDKMGGVRQACESMEHTYEQVIGSSKIAALPYTKVKRSA